MTSSMYQIALIVLSIMAAAVYLVKGDDILLLIQAMYLSAAFIIGGLRK